MGYNTAAIILNDGLDQIAKDTNIGAKIDAAVGLAQRGRLHPIGIESGIDISAGYHVNAMQVLPSQHADIDQIIIIGGNYARSVINLRNSPHRCTEGELQEWLLEQLADHLGYELKKVM